MAAAALSVEVDTTPDGSRTAPELTLDFGQRATANRHPVRTSLFDCADSRFGQHLPGPAGPLASGRKLTRANLFRPNSLKLGHPTLSEALRIGRWQPRPLAALELGPNAG